MARFLKDKKKATGAAPGSLIFIGQQKMAESYLRVIRYNAEYIKEDKFSSFQEVPHYLSDNHMTWISLYGLHQTELVAQMGRIFGISSLLLEDILNTDERPKLSEDDHHISIILKALQFNKEYRKVKIEQISLIMGKNYLITVQETDFPYFKDVEKRLTSGMSKMRSYSSDYLCYTLIDTLVDNYMINIETLGSEIEEQEKILLTDNKQIIKNIYHYKTELAYIRKNIRPVKEVITRFMTSDSDLINSRIYNYLKDLESLVTQALEAIEIYYTMISDQQNIYNTNITNNVNDVMKLLTVFSAIFIPLTFIAGIYGMNFEFMPELKYHWGYFILLGVMAVIATVMLFYFKRKKWI